MNNISHHVLILLIRKMSIKSLSRFHGNTERADLLAAEGSVKSYPSAKKVRSMAQPERKRASGLFELPVKVNR